MWYKTETLPVLQLDLKMKFLSVLAFVVSVVSALAWREPPQSHQGWKEPNRPAIATYSTVDCSIPANQVILHPHPTSCTKFLQCNHGTPLARPCAPGTEFSPSIGVCVHAWQSDCTAEQEEEDEEEVVEEPELSEEVPESPEEPVGDTTEVDDLEDATDLPEALEGSPLAPIGARAKRAFSICARSPTRVFIASDPTDCASYVICAFGGPVLKTCANGQYFDASRLQCLTGACQA